MTTQTPSPDDEERLTLGENAACLHVDGSLVQVIFPKSRMGQPIQQGSAAYDVALCAFFLSEHPVAYLARAMLSNTFDSLLAEKIQPTLSRMDEEGKTRSDDLTEALQSKPPVPPSNLH